MSTEFINTFSFTVNAIYRYMPSILYIILLYAFIFIICIKSILVLFIIAYSCCQYDNIDRNFSFTKINLFCSSKMFNCQFWSKTYPHHYNYYSKTNFTFNNT